MGAREVRQESVWLGLGLLMGMGGPVFVQVSIYHEGLLLIHVERLNQVPAMLKHPALLGRTCYFWGGGEEERPSLTVFLGF